MSKIDVTTQDLLRRLGPTSRSRSTKADALFRLLRLEQADKVADALSRGPRAVKASEFTQKPVVTPAD